MNDPFFSSAKIACPCCKKYVYELHPCIGIAKNPNNKNKNGSRKRKTNSPIHLEVEKPLHLPSSVNVNMNTSVGASIKPYLKARYGGRS